jgi:acyl carrier protein
MMGSSGQSQYNGASTFQDAFARHRWSLGEKCVSIDIGVVGDVGYVAEHSDVARRWERKGIQVLDEKEIHSLVDWACNPCREFPTSWSTQIITGAGQLAGRQTDNADLLPHLKRPIFSSLLQENGFRESNTASQSMAQKVNYGALLSGAQNTEEAGKIIATGVASFLSNALCVPVEDIDTARTVHSYGVDSLMAVELRFWFKEKIEAETSVFELLANKSILALSRSMASKSKYRVE